jgi:hypothetical protein
LCIVGEGARNSRRGSLFTVCLSHAATIVAWR